MVFVYFENYLRSSIYLKISNNRMKVLPIPLTGTSLHTISCENFWMDRCLQAVSRYSYFSYKLTHERINPKWMVAYCLRITNQSSASIPHTSPAMPSTSRKMVASKSLYAEFIVVLSSLTSCFCCLLEFIISVSLVLLKSYLK